MKHPRAFFAGIALTLLALLIGSGSWKVMQYWDNNKLALQSQQAMTAFRTQFNIADDTTIRVQRWQGQTIYLFAYQEQNYLLAAGQWIKLSKIEKEVPK